MKTPPDTKHLSLASIVLAIFAGTYKVTSTPTQKVAEGETVLGTADNKVVQGLYRARQELGTAANLVGEFLKDVEKKPEEYTVQTEREAQAEYRRLLTELKNATELFWDTARAVVPGGTHESNIAVRENWVLVAFPQEPECPDFDGLKVPGGLLSALLAGRRMHL
ncbi:MAG: hypothetical protein Q7R64_02290 [bacterium]|nr:hypothetical protein [bacterium]